MARMTPEQFEDGEHRENEKQIAVHICRIVDAMQTGKKIGGGLNQSAARRPSISTRKTEIAT
jgi:hypothetical protein